MTHAAIGAEVDQALDRELNFTTKIAFDGELRNRITNAFEFSIGKVLNLLRAGDAALFKNQAAARTADAIDGGETDFGEPLCYLFSLDAACDAGRCRSRGQRLCA